ncbi:MAG: hypothetical protein ACXIVO_13775 [Glycocaulis sp.]
MTDRPSPVTHSPLVRAKIDLVMEALRGQLPAHPQAPAMLERSLTALAGLAFQAGRDFERSQLAEALEPIPADARAAHARGLYQGLEAVNQARTLDEARDIIMAISVHVAPSHLRASQPEPARSAASANARLSLCEVSPERSEGD